MPTFEIFTHKHLPLNSILIFKTKLNKSSLQHNQVPGIAHNKILIIDDETIITGSYNFTQAAETRNAENLLIIKDAKLAKQYSDNWYRLKQK